MHVYVSISAGLMYKDEPLFVHKHLMGYFDVEWVRKHTLHNTLSGFKSRQKFEKYGRSGKG
jgi:hypothetical protein